MAYKELRDADPLSLEFTRIFDLSPVLPEDAVHTKYHVMVNGPNFRTVEPVVQKICRMFNLQDIVIMCGDYAIPEREEVLIFGLTRSKDLRVEFKTERKKPPVRRKNKNLDSMNSVAYFLNLARESHSESAVSETSVKELSNPQGTENSLGFSTPGIENSFVSDGMEKEDFSDNGLLPRKRKRVRKHKKKSNDNSATENAWQDPVPESQEAP